MPPFLPGLQHAKSKTKQRGPTAVPRHKSDYTFYHHKSNPKSPIVLDPQDSYGSDFDSQAETEYTRTDVQDYLVKPDSEPTMSGNRPTASRDRMTKVPEYGRGMDNNRGTRGGEASRTPQRPNDREDNQGDYPSYGPDEMNQQFQETSMRDALPFPVDRPSLYEQILVLRHHGATVTHDPSSRNAYIHGLDSRNRSPPSLARGFGPSFDAEKPNHDEIKAVDHALAHVINTGGKVKFSPFDRHPHLDSNALLTCDSCSRPFHTVRDRDMHVGGGLVKCPTCSALFRCQTKLDEHASQFHRSHRGPAYPGSPNMAYAESFDRNEHPSWGKGSPH